MHLCRICDLRPIIHLKFTFVVNLFDLLTFVHDL